jgi:hypothetical protein
MTRHATSARSARAATVVVACAAASALLSHPQPADAAKPCKTSCRDTAAPSVSIAAPGAGATVSATVAVSGASSDNVSVAAVAVAVDGGAWQTATGTTAWSWSWSTVALANGSHTLAARATDTSGNTKVVSETVTVANAVADTTAPSVGITAPAAGATVSGTVAVSGSASDDVSVARVDVAVDGGTWAAATGGTSGSAWSSWSWSWASAGVANGSHALAARATDTSGNTKVVVETVNVSNVDTTAPSVSITAPVSGSTVAGTVNVSGTATDDVAVSSVAVAVDGGTWAPASGTSSWSWSWNTATVSEGQHTVAVRVVDGSGNGTTASESVSVSNTAPNTQGSWVSPEGVTINVNSAGPWTVAQIYSILKADALDLDKVGPKLTVNVQDQYTSQTVTSATYYLGKYVAVASTMWLQGTNSSFATRPDDTLTHEYGHAWSRYWYYLAHNGDWSGYSSARWTTSDGSLTLATDSRTGSSYTWQIGEIIADDYRLLFGSSLAISERPTHLNNQIPDPRDVPGLSSFLLTTWRTG